MRPFARGPGGRAPAPRRWGLLLVALLAAGCGSDDGSGSAAGPVSDSVYVEVMARLVLLDSLMASDGPHQPEGLTRDSARGLILGAHGVRGDELLEFARERGTRPERMEAIWRRIHELSDSLGETGWRPAGSDTAAAGGVRDDGVP